MSTSTALHLNLGMYQEVISGISTVFAFSDGVAKLTGPVGVGKSSVLWELIKELRAENIAVMHFSAVPKSGDEVQASLIREFRLGADLSFRKSLTRYLLSRPRDQQRLIMVFDDAEQITVETLKNIHSYRELEHNHQSFISILLCGDSRLNALLSHPELAALQADISLNYSLQPLESETLKEFCSAYLQHLGKGRLVLASDYLQTLQQFSQGLPEQVIRQLDEAMKNPDFLDTYARPAEAETATREGLPIVSKVIEGIAEQLDQIPPETKRWLKPTAQVLFSAAALSSVYVYYPRAVSLYQTLTGPGTAAPTVTTTTAPAPTVPATPPEVAATQAPAVEPAAEAPAPAVVATTAPATATTPEPAAVPASTPAAPTPTASPTAAPVTAPLIVQQIAAASGSLEETVEQWLDAWQSQNSDAYLKLYHTDFAPFYHDTLANWRVDRARSLTRPSNISLSISDWQVVSSSPLGTTVQFWLDYRSPTYVDRTLKQLVLAPDLDGQLRILQEYNREVVRGSVTPLPPNTAVSLTTTAGSNITKTTLVGPPITVSPEPQMPAGPVGPAELALFIRSWLDAWQHKDLASYFNHYDPGFTGMGLGSTAAWRDDRILKISRPAVIQLQLLDLEVVESDAASSLVRLTLDYHSSFYADRTRKELRLAKRADGSWQIVMERNTQVEPLPLARLVATNTLAALF